MMKIPIKTILSIVMLLLFVQQCTNINLVPTFVDNKEGYRYLSEGVRSENFRIENITDKTHAFITYDTINNFFIIDDSYSKIKVDSHGNVKLKIPHPSGELPYKTHYVFTDSTVWDLSKVELNMESYARKINPKEEKLEVKWIALFEEYYKKADVVIYGDEVIYMKVNEHWILFHLPEDYYIRRDNMGENTFEGYPAKHKKLIFLKDANSNIYSDWSSRIGLYDQNNYPEDDLEYTTEGLENIAFEKVRYSEKYAYTPIIARFIGIGYYKMYKEDEVIRFKEDASKNPFSFFKSESHLIHYTLPKRYSEKTEVSVLKYAFGTNQNPGNSEGIYVVKRK